MYTKTQSRHDVRSWKFEERQASETEGGCASAQKPELACLPLRLLSDNKTSVDIITNPYVRAQIIHVVNQTTDTMITAEHTSLWNTQRCPHPT